VYIGVSSVEIKSEADSNDSTECSHDDKPSTGMFAVSDDIFSEVIGLYISCVMFAVDVVTGRLPWQPAAIKFTHCVSGDKSAFTPLQEKLCVGSKNDCHLLELSRRSLSACKVWGRLNYVRRL